MRLIFFFLLLLFLNNFSILSQTNKQIWKAVFLYQKIYTVKEKARMDSLIKNDDFYRQMQDYANNNIHHKTYVMYLDNQVSKFYQKIIDKNPEIAEYINQKNKDKYLFKSLKSGKYIQNYSILSISYTVTDSLPDFHWHITGEQKKIGKYTVIKAIGQETRTYRKDGKLKDIHLELTAWFCPDIPVPNGPELYGGLPGFIMELSAGKDIFLLKEISVNLKKKIKIKPPVVQKHKGTYKEFLKEQGKIYQRFKKRYENRRNKQENLWQN